MTLYLVPRTRAWLSEEELAATADCIPAVIDTLRDTSAGSAPTSCSEDDGTFSAVLHLRGHRPEALRRHADALMLPTDAIKPVGARSSRRPEPAAA